MARKSYGNPAHRTRKGAGLRAQDNLQHAHREVVAALEWLQRGGPEQFLQSALDRAHLGYRFLHELLVEHGRIEMSADLEDE